MVTQKSRKSKILLLRIVDNLISVNMIPQLSPSVYCEVLNIDFKFKINLILVREREVLES